MRFLFKHFQNIEEVIFRHCTYYYELLGIHNMHRCALLHPGDIFSSAVLNTSGCKIYPSAITFIGLNFISGV